MAQGRTRSQDDPDAGGPRVVAAILQSGDRVLLCHRAPDRQWYPDVWDFPGGHVEDGERPERLRRELIEEIGVDVGVVADAPVLHLIDDRTGFDLIVWHVTSWTGTVQNCQLEEHDEVSWRAEAELRDPRLRGQELPHRPSPDPWGDLIPGPAVEGTPAGRRCSGYGATRVGN